MLEYFKHLCIGIGFTPFSWKVMGFIDDKAFYFWLGPIIGFIGSDKKV